MCVLSFEWKRVGVMVMVMMEQVSLDEWNEKSMKENEQDEANVRCGIRYWKGMDIVKFSARLLSIDRSSPVIELLNNIHIGLFRCRENVDYDL